MIKQKKKYAEQTSTLARPDIQPGSTVLFPQQGLEDLEPALDRLLPAEVKSVGDAPRKKATKKSSKKPLGSSRGIETMFRTAYRAQLDLTALAATKANIMISLNGLILSVLTLSGPFVLVAEPMFTAPIAVFLTTCLTSIIFAVLAAQPRFGKRKNFLEDFKSDKANILVFEQFSSLNIEEHTQVMIGLLRNSKRIYKNMSRQLYLLGIDANRKFRLLKLSYMSFLIGLTLSTLMLLAVGMLFHVQDMGEIMSSLQSRVLPAQ
ncbi:MAG: DUF5706 domain-containing protein [Gammaproteobacteria bacterium]|nr:DUF5706 domain-containing protein [Gammaproteobacteria bacterium]